MDVIEDLLFKLDNTAITNIFYPVLRTALAHLDAIPQMTAQEMAEKCGVSQATVSRFAKFAGFSSFQQMKVEIARALGTQQECFAMPVQAEPRGVQYYKQRLEDGLSALQEQLQPAVCYEICTALRNAGDILFHMTIQHSARQLQRLLFADGKMAQINHFPQEAKQILTGMHRGDFLLLTFKEQWEISRKRSVLDTAQARGVEVMVLSALPELPLAKPPRFQIVFPSDEEIVIQAMENIVFEELCATYRGMM